MSAIIAKQNIDTSRRDGQTKSKPTRKQPPCKHCGASHKLIILESPTDNLVCQVCGRRGSDIAVFYFVCSQSDRLASPEFGTAAEALHFAAIFDMSLYNGYELVETLHLFNPNGLERDEEKRKAVLADLTWGKYALELLRNADFRARFPGEHGLEAMCKKLSLDQLALPMFRNHPVARGVI